MPTSQEKIAVLLMAYGGPNSLADVPAYLNDVRGGQPVSPALLEETTRRYKLIGGRSPLLDISRRLAAKLQNKIGLPVYVGMRHWQPRIADAVAEIKRAGIQRIVAICLAPHYSPLSIGAYRAKLEDALLALRAEPSNSSNAEPALDFIEAWGTQPRYLDGIAANVRALLDQFPKVMVIFTAHSLPVSAREPYEPQLRETAQLIAQKLGLPADRWMLSFQSVSRTGVPWLEPQIEKLVPQLAADGERNFIIAPIGFLAEHLEVLYDLDIGLQEIANANHVRVVRTPMLNDSDALVDALAELVHEKIAHPTLRNP
jgi:ferrochelatase